jgi:LPPG:FO 2-phospho-L-lactate transferase
MLDGLRGVIDGSELIGIVNTGDDLCLHGLQICPDLDTITYTLAGLNNSETGWGLRGESWRVMEELEALGGEAWFRLGDRDLALHLYRTQRLSEGASLSEVTAELLAHFDVDVTLLPATHGALSTRFTTPELGVLSFQEYFVKHRHAVAVSSVSFEGASRATPAPGVLDALEQADLIVISPSNPIISIGPIVAIDAIREALVRRRDDVVAVSPLIGGKALKGPADRLLEELGLSASSLGVARCYAELAATLVIDALDGDDAASVESTGMRCVVAETLMDDAHSAAELARVLLDA